MNWARCWSVMGRSLPILILRSWPVLRRRRVHYSMTLVNTACGGRLSMPTDPAHRTITATAAAPATAEDQRKTSLATRTSVESVSFEAISS